MGQGLHEGGGKGGIGGGRSGANIVPIGVAVGTGRRGGSGGEEVKGIVGIVRIVLTVVVVDGFFLE